MKRLIVSVHDVTPEHGLRIDRLMGLIEESIGPGKAALLAVPHFHHRTRIGSDRRFAVKLRRWAEAGHEVFLHGYCHLDDMGHDDALTSWKAKFLTAGEGEFLGLGYDAASQRLRDGRREIEDVIGRPVAGFVAPAWLYGPATLQALTDLDFPLAESHFRVWDPRSGQVLERGPVITYASRTPMRLLSSLLWSRVAGVLLKPAPVVRIGVHPHDWDAPELVREIGRTLRHFVTTHQPSQYSDLIRVRASAAGAETG